MSEAQLSVSAAHHSQTSLTWQLDPGPSTPFFDLDSLPSTSPHHVDDVRNNDIRTAAEQAHKFWIATLEGNEGVAALVHQHGTLLWCGSINTWIRNFARDHPDVRAVVMDPASPPDYQTLPGESVAFEQRRAKDRLTARKDRSAARESTIAAWENRSAAKERRTVRADTSTAMKDRSASCFIIKFRDGVYRRRGQ
jgi:hypothetical protein